MSDDYKVNLDKEENNNEEPNGKNNINKKGILGTLAAILAVLVKFKFIPLLILSKLKYIFALLKFGKFGGTFISMFVTIFIYAKIYGFYFGLGFVLLILVHEIGHYITAKQLNLDVSGPVFIPFIGALISMKETPKDAVVEAKVAFGGPILGTSASLLCMYIGFEYNMELFLVLSYVGFIINLFNLIPISPLDGGRIVKAISPKIWYLGIPILIFLMIKLFSPIMLIIIIVGIREIIDYYKNKTDDYYNISGKSRAIFGTIYFSLIGLLTFLIFYVQGIIEVTT